MNLKNGFRLALLLGSAVMLHGCWFYGGGWLWSEKTEGEKVTVGFEGTCTEYPDPNNPNQIISQTDLSFTFHDHGFTGPGVYDQNKKGSKHMVIEAVGSAGSTGDVGVCSDGIEMVGDGSAIGNLWFYCPPGIEDPFDLLCGVAYGWILDTTDNGPDKGDEFCLVIPDEDEEGNQVENGFYAGYSFGDCDPATPEGKLQGGNFTVENVIEETP